LSSAVGGTTADDKFRFVSRAGGGIEASLDGVSLGVFVAAGRILAFGQAGDDDLQAAGDLGQSVWFYGGDGDDRLKGGAGHDVLLGDGGADLVLGGSGRDLLVGGLGADRIIGNADDDILIAGDLDFADLSDAIAAVMAEWTSAREQATRVQNLRGMDETQGNTVFGDRLNGNYFLRTADTVSNDDAADVLTGASGLDWFFFDVSRDRATDLIDEAFADDLAFIS
jgi:Ca2+-binding RTX toxin-like protein